VAGSLLISSSNGCRSSNRSRSKNIRLLGFTAAIMPMCYLLPEITIGGLLGLSWGSHFGDNYIKFLLSVRGFCWGFRTPNSKISTQ
jgi:hypothetical protein